VQLQETKQVVVAGIFDKHRVARFEHVAHQQVEPLARAIGDEDLRCVGLDAELREAALQVFAQDRVAVRRRIVDKARGVRPRHVADCLTEAVHVAPCFRDKAAAELERLSRVVELLQDVDRFFFGPARVRNALRAAQAAVPLGNEKSRAVARIEVAERDQPVVRLDHREAAHTVVGGELADRRQLGARMGSARADPGGHAGDDLLGQRHAVFAVEFDIEFHEVSA
jgi:hypothetical protein